MITNIRIGGTAMVESALQNECSFLFKVDASATRKRKSGNASELHLLEKNTESLLQYIREERKLVEGKHKYFY